MEDQFNERARMEDRLLIGALPAGITHPIAAGMMRRAAAQAAAPAVAMEVDEPETQVVVNHPGQSYQTDHRKHDREVNLIPHLEDYNTEESMLIRRKPPGPGVAPYVPNPAVMRSLNIKIRARNPPSQINVGSNPSGG